jgi:hypothetical protein
MSQPLPSSGEFGRLAAIYLRLAFSGLKQVSVLLGVRHADEALL